LGELQKLSNSIIKGRVNIIKYIKYMTLTEQAQELLNKEEIKKKIEIIAGKLSRIKELENKIIDIKKEIERIEKER
jgi:hypothetical protein